MLGEACPWRHSRCGGRGTLGSQTCGIFGTRSRPERSQHNWCMTKTQGKGDGNTQHSDTGRQRGSEKAIGRWRPSLTAGIGGSCQMEAKTKNKKTPHIRETEEKESWLWRQADLSSSPPLSIMYLWKTLLAGSLPDSLLSEHSACAASCGHMTAFLGNAQWVEVIWTSALRSPTWKPPDCHALSWLALGIKRKNSKMHGAWLLNHYLEERPGHPGTPALDFKWAGNTYLPW